MPAVEHKLAQMGMAPTRGLLVEWPAGLEQRRGPHMPSSIANSIAVVAESIAATLGPRAMRIIAQFNKYVTNPLQRLWAPWLPYMAVIEHTGRKSGKPYRTPVMAFIDSRSVRVVLNYGTQSDWVRNVRAAGAADVVHRAGGTACPSLASSRPPIRRPGSSPRWRRLLPLGRENRGGATQVWKAASQKQAIGDTRRA